MSGMLEPGIRVPGARPVTDIHAGMAVPAYDKKGRPLWTLPAPSGQAVHTHRYRRVRHTGELFRVSVPVYRGVSAEEARRIRARHRRLKRKDLPTAGVYDTRGMPVGGHKYSAHRAERNKLRRENP